MDRTFGEELCAAPAAAAPAPRTTNPARRTEHARTLHMAPSSHRRKAPEEEFRRLRLAREGDDNGEDKTRTREAAVYPNREAE